MAASDYVFREEFEHLLAALMPDNRLALEVSLTTGLRISDVLSIKTAALKERITVREQKTGKQRRIRFPRALLLRLYAAAGPVYVFEHRYTPTKHRTRQAVYKDLKRAAKLFRVREVVSPHSARKVYAVEQYHRDGDLKRVQRLLNHSSEAVTMLYAMADVLTERRERGRK